jgi:hypothetical protein
MSPTAGDVKLDWEIGASTAAISGSKVNGMVAFLAPVVVGVDPWGES